MELQSITENQKKIDSLLQKINNCLLFSGEESFATKQIRTLSARERARWLLEHPGVREFLLRAFYRDPKPESKEELWNDIFGQLSDPPPRWHHFSSSEINIWFNTKRSTTLRHVQNKFHTDNEDWQSELPKYLSTP
jgi:hypothetical protein